MKKIRLIISIILICVMLALVGCNESTTPADEITDAQDTSTLTPAETTTPALEQPKQILVADLSKYNVVRPDKSDQQIINAVSDFYSALKSSFSDEISLKTDFLIPGNAKYEASEYEILIGATNRDETQDFMSKLRVNDYGYAVYGSKIVITGGSDASTMLAIQAFQKDIVNKRPDANGVFVSESDHFVFNSEYSVDDLKLNGKSITDYTIVYKYLGTHGEKDLANSLRSNITTLTGYVLDVVSDKEEPNGGAEILIGVTNRSVDSLYDKSLENGEYFIGSEDKYVVIWGSVPFATMSAVNDFGRQLEDSAGGNTQAELNISDSVGKIQEDIGLSAMSFNIWVSGRSEERDARAVKMVLNYMPDVVGFQEASPGWMSVLIDNLGAYYAYVGEGRDGGSNGEYNPIFYRKDKFKLIESGTKWLSETPDTVSKYSESSLNRIYTYAKLERISDGAVFMHINTHFDHKSSVARELQAKVLVGFIAKNVGMPMIITGDFNCETTTAAYKTLIDGGLSNSYDVAEMREKGATFHGNGSSSKVIDFIFVEPSQVYVTQYDICNEKVDGGYVSDHHPIYIDFYIIN